MVSFIQLQITFPNKLEANQFARKLLEQKQAACVQVVGPIISTYWWHGELETAEEYLLLAKTRSKRFDEIAAWIQREHSYECPQIVAVPLTCISQDYEKWLGEQLS